MAGEEGRTLHRRLFPDEVLVASLEKMGRRRNSSLSRVPGSGRGPLSLRIKQGQAVDPRDVAGVTRGAEMGRWLLYFVGKIYKLPLCLEIKTKLFSASPFHLSFQTSLNSLQRF